MARHPDGAASCAVTDGADGGGGARGGAVPASSRAGDHMTTARTTSRPSDTPARRYDAGPGAGSGNDRPRNIGHSPPDGVTGRAVDWTWGRIFVAISLTVMSLEASF